MNKEKSKNKNLTKQKKSKSKTILTSVKVSSEKRCTVPDLLGLQLNLATSNMSTPLREINNALPEKTATYPKTLTVPCTTISLVISNTKTSIVSVAKSNILTAPIMATGIQPVLQRNPALSNLGPGTLILSDGRIMPVPPPAPTVLTTATQFIVNRPTQPAVIVMQNSPSIKQGKTQRVLVPKPKRKDSTKTTFVNKVPIPAIKTHDTRIHVKSNTDHLSIITNTKKQKVSVKSKNTKSQTSVKISESIIRPNENIPKTIIKQNNEVKINSDEKNTSKSKKRTRNNVGTIPSKRMKINEKIKNTDKRKVEGCIDTLFLNSNNAVNVHKNNEKEKSNCKLQNNKNNIVNDGKSELDTMSRQNFDSPKNDVIVLDKNNTGNSGSSAQTIQDSCSQNIVDIIKTSEIHSTTAQTEQNVIHDATNNAFLNNTGISYQENISNNIIGSPRDAKINSSICPKTMDIVSTGSSVNQTDHSSLITIVSNITASSTNNNTNLTTVNASSDSQFDYTVNSVTLKNKHAFETKSNSVTHKSMNVNGNHSTTQTVTEFKKTVDINASRIQNTKSQNTMNLKENNPNKDESLGENFTGNRKVDYSVGQNISDVMSFNSFSVKVDQSDQKRNKIMDTTSSSSQNDYSRQTNIESITSTQTNQNRNLQNSKNNVTLCSSSIGQHLKQNVNEIRNTLTNNQTDHSTHPSIGHYQTTIGTFLGGKNSQNSYSLSQTITDSRNLMGNSENIVKEHFVPRTIEMRGNPGNSKNTLNNSNRQMSGILSNCTIMQNSHNQMNIDFKSPTVSSTNTLNVHSVRHTNVGISGRMVNSMITQNDQSVQQANIGPTKSTKNTLNDHSNHQTNMDISRTIGNSTIKNDQNHLMTTDFRGTTSNAKNTLNVRQANMSVSSTNQTVHQTSIDFTSTTDTLIDQTNQQTNMGNISGTVNATIIQTDRSVYQANIDFRSATKNTLNDHSIHQTNMNVTNNIGKCTTMQNVQTVQQTNTNTLNDNSIHQTNKNSATASNAMMQNNRITTDFKSATGNFKNNQNDHPIHQTNMNANGTTIMRNNQTANIDFRVPTSSKSGVNDHSILQTNTGISSIMINPIMQNIQTDFRGSSNTLDRSIHQANMDISNSLNMQNSNSVHVSTQNSHSVHQQNNDAISFGSTHGQNNNSVNQTRIDNRESIPTSKDFRSPTFSNTNTHTSHSIHRANNNTGSQSTFTLNDKPVCHANIDFRNPASNSTNSLNDQHVIQTNIDFRDIMGTASNVQNDNSICHTMGVSTINQTDTSFRGSVSTTTGLTKNDSISQINTEFRIPTSTTNTQHIPSVNIDRTSIGSKNTHNHSVRQNSLDFRGTGYTQNNHQSNMDVRSNSGTLSHNDNLIQTNINMRGTTSMTFRGPTFNSTNNNHSIRSTINETVMPNQTQIDKTSVMQKGSIVSSINSIGQPVKDTRCITNSNYTHIDQSVQKVKDVNVPATNNSQIVQSTSNHKSTQISNSKTSVQNDQKTSESFVNSSCNPQTSVHRDVKDVKENRDIRGSNKNVLLEKDKTKNVLNNNSFNIDKGNVKPGGFPSKNNDVVKTITKEQIQNYNESKLLEKGNQKNDCNMKKDDHSETMKLQTCTENVFRDLNYRDRNTFIPISHCMDEMRLTLSNTEFSNDLFSSLQVPSGGQHPESISPTAAFLLAFPLVSTSKTSEILAENENSDSQHATPTTILQIGNIDPPGSELYQSVENALQFQNVKTKRDDKTDKPLKSAENFGRFQQFEMNDRIPQNYTNFRIDDSFDKNSCKQKKSNFMSLQEQELFLSCDKKKTTEKNCPYLAQGTTGNFTGVEFQTRNVETQNSQQNTTPNQPMINQKKTALNIPTSQYSYNVPPQPYYNLFSSNNDFPASVTSNFTTTQTTLEQQKVTTQNLNQNNFSSVLSWTMPMTTTSTPHHEYTTPYTTFPHKTQPYSNQNAKQNQVQSFERKEKQTSLPKFSTNFQFGNNRHDLPQYQTNENQLNYKDSKGKKSKTNQPRPPVNWMTTPDVRPVLSDHMTTLLPDVMFPTKDLDFIPPQNTILNSCSNIPPFNIPTSISNNQTFYPNSHFSGIDLPLDLPPFPEITTTKQNRSNQQNSQYSWSPNKTIPLLPHLDNHTLAIPSTLPTLVGDLALGTNTGPSTPAENFRNYPLPNNFNPNTVKKCDTKQECQKSNKLPDKDCLVNNERRNTTRPDYCKTHSNQSTNTSGSFLSVSQLVDQAKSDRNVQRRGTKQTVCKPSNAQKRSNVTDKHNMKNVSTLNYPSINNGVQQRKNENNFTDERNKSVGYPGTFPTSNIPPPWQTGKTNTAQFKGGSYSAESLIGVNSDTNVMNHENLPDFSSSNQFTNQYNQKPFTDTTVSTTNTYNTDFTQNIQHGTEYTQTQQPYQNCFNFPSQNSIYTSTTTAPFMESDYQLGLDPSYVFHHPSTNSCQTNQNIKDRSIQSTKRNPTNKRRDDYPQLPINQPVSTFLQTPQMYPSSSQYVNSRSGSNYLPTSSCASGNNTTSSLAHHGTTTLTNFNLSTIFPEINDKVRR